MDKRIILLLMISLLLVGCGKKEEQTCDYKPFIDQSASLMEQNTECNKLKSTCEANLGISKNDNNALKIQLLNSNNQTGYKDCTTCTRLLFEKEVALEECWMNTTIHRFNYTDTNATLVEMYDNCSTKLKDINDTLRR